MKKSILTILSMVLWASFSHGQEKGIKFESNLSWSQIKEKAKSENKYIFIDCFATWCGPCREMDKNVYPDAAVGEFFNKEFISMKVQQDKTPIDNAATKARYADAEYIIKEYKITAFPTLLFLSPDGELKHKAVGGYNSDAFIRIGQTALDTKTQYYTLIEAYKKGNRDTATLKKLAMSAKSFNEEDLSKKIASDYLDQISEEEQLKNENIIFTFEVAQDKVRAAKLFDIQFSRMTDSELLNKGSIELMRAIAENSESKAFRFLFQNSRKVDSVLQQKNVFQEYFDYIIAREEIDPLIAPKGILASVEPDWTNIGKTISKKYSRDYAIRTVAGAKVRWFGANKRWDSYSKALIEKLDLTKGNQMDGFQLNNDVWNVFQYSNSKRDLNRAIYWMDKLFIYSKKDALNHANLDTYANLLYKVGRNKDAIYWEEKALKIATAEKDFNSVKTYYETIDKIKNGRVSWPVNN